MTMTFVFKDYWPMIGKRPSPIKPIKINDVLLDTILENWTSGFKKKLSDALVFHCAISDIFYSELFYSELSASFIFIAPIKNQQKEKKINYKAYFNMRIIRTRKEEFINMDSIKLKYELEKLI